MTTYAPSGTGRIRQYYAHRTLDSLFRHLHGANLRLHVADDGSDDDTYIKHMCIRAQQIWGLTPHYTNSQRRGIGASLNLALAQLKDDYWMYITDDWVLTKDLDVSQAIKLLTIHTYGFVRLGPIHPNIRATVKFNAEHGWWLELDPSSGGFVFATRPFIAPKWFHQNVGPFDEGLDAYETERLYSKRVASTNIKAAYLGSISLGGPWEHIGEHEVGREVIHIS